MRRTLTSIISGERFNAPALGWVLVTSLRFAEDRSKPPDEHAGIFTPATSKSYDGYDHERFSDINHEHDTTVCFPLRRYSGHEPKGAADVAFHSLVYGRKQRWTNNDTSESFMKYLSPLQRVKWTQYQPACIQKNLTESLLWESRLHKQYDPPCGAWFTSGPA
jgi:hypothetical protein